MKLRYWISQGLRMLWGNKLQTVLLVLCYTGGFFLPMAMLAYQQGVMSTYEEPPSSDYTVILNNITENDFTTLKDYNYLTRLLSAGDSLQIHFLGVSLNWLFFFEGQAVKASVNWRLPDNGEDIIYSVIESERITGRWLSQDEPYEVLLGDKILKGYKPEELIGREIIIGAETYTIGGIISGYDAVVANALTVNQVSSVVLGFKIPNNTAETADLLFRKLDDIFSVSSSTLNKNLRDQFYEKERNETNSLLAVSITGFIFCFLNSFGIINSFLYDNKQRIFIKLTLGAKRADIFFEIMVFCMGITLAASLLAYLFSKGAKVYMSLFFRQPLIIGWPVFVQLVIISIATSSIASLYSVWKTARRLA